MIDKQKLCNTWSVKTVLIIAVMLFTVVSQSFAIKGVIVKSPDNKRMRGDIRWSQSKKEYIITANDVTMTLKPSQVSKVIVPMPAGFDKAVKNVAAKRYDAALPVLNKIMTDYKMMDWDVKATRYAAEAHLGMKNAKKAILLCEQLIRNNPQAAYQGEIAEIYWQALVEGDRTATLRKVMAKVIKNGPRELVPLVQIRRADVDMKAGKYKEALVDGYLRTAVFFAEDKRYAPEALYKAMECFQQLNEPTNAEKMRKKLMADFPDSEYNK